MCNFLSWIEKDSEILYLDDKDVFSKRGKEVLRETQRKQDMLGHGAIRKFYAAPDGTPLQGGRDCEESDWNLSKLPPVLQEKLQSFMTHWGRMLREGFFPNYSLSNLVCFAPAEVKELAWEQLLPKADNWDLRQIIYYGPEKYKALAWERLRDTADNRDFRYIIEDGPEKYKALAWEQLKDKASNRDLCCITAWGSEKCRALAWEQLKDKAGNADLRLIIYYGPKKYKKQAQAELDRR